MKLYSIFNLIGYLLLFSYLFIGETDLLVASMSFFSATIITIIYINKREL